MPQNNHQHHTYMACQVKSLRMTTINLEDLSIDVLSVEEGTNRGEERQCYVCWESQSTESNPIRTDCGCKGTGGWVHLQCLAELSAQCRDNAIDCPLLRPWSVCGVCTQPYKEPTKSSLEYLLRKDGPGLARMIITSFGEIFEDIVVTCPLPLCIFGSVRFYAITLIQRRQDLFSAVTPMWNGLSQEIQTNLICAGVALLLTFVYSNRVQIKRIVAKGLVFLQAFFILYSARVIMRVVGLHAARVIMRVVRFLRSGAYRNIFCILCICLLIVVAFDPAPEMALLRAKIRRDIRQGINLIRQGMIVIWQALVRIVLIRRDGRLQLLAAITAWVLMLVFLYDGSRCMAYIMACVAEFLCTFANRIDASLSADLGGKIY